METIIITGESETNINIAQNLQAQLADVGVDLELVQLETNVYVDRWLAADFDSALSENNSNPDPHSTYSRYFISGANFENVGGLTSPELDELFAQGLAETDPEARVPIYAEISRILLEESPWVWLYRATATRSCRPTSKASSPIRPARWRRCGKSPGFRLRVWAVPRSRGADVDHVRAVVQTAVDAGVVPGAVAHRPPPGRRGAPRGVRVGEPRPADPADAPDTVFDLASLTKPLVGAGVALALVDRGCFSLDEEVTAWFPELEQFRAKGVTLRRLLAHTAGVTGWRPVYTGADGLDEVVRAIGALGLAAAPGARFEYSDLGYILLGAALDPRRRAKPPRARPPSCSSSRAA